jgi:predicted nucleotidyltransferase
MGLLNLVRKDKEMRRLFGQQELKIIEKQLLGIKLSASEKTRLSRDIKPKFNIIEKISDFKQEFKIKKSQEIKFLIEQTKEILLENDYKGNIKKIVVFGSFVEDKLRFDSDIDISVEFNKISEKEANQLKMEMLGKLNPKIQLSVFNILPKKVQDEVLKKGRTIYLNGKN